MQHRAGLISTIFEQGSYPMRKRNIATATAEVFPGSMPRPGRTQETTTLCLAPEMQGRRRKTCMLKYPHGYEPAARKPVTSQETTGTTQHRRGYTRVKSPASTAV